MSTRAKPLYRPVDSRQSFPALEEQVLERWRRLDVFHKSLEIRRTAEPPAQRFVFYEGPPTANGEPGSHHVLSRVFKDIFPRYKTMCGYYVPRKAGWDCHGLPVELEIESQLGIKSKEDIERYGIAAFNEKCRESVFAYVEQWNRLTERIGFWIDLDDAYKTLTNDYIESVWWSLRQIWDRELLYEDDKVVPYCPRCGTALSSHEVALGYRDVTDPSVYLRFPLKDREGALLVWTTTPWTLISNTAVAVHPDVTYVAADVGGEVLWVAEPLLESVLGEEVEPKERLRGSELEGLAYEPPFTYFGDLGEKAHRVYAASFVTTDDGTGLVHIAPAFGEDDLGVARQHGAPTVNPVRDDGTFDERVTDFAGRFVKDADEDIIANLQERGLLFRSAGYEHAYPHCWRCDTPLLYYAKSSWYIRTTAVRDEMLAANETINWHPAHIKHGRFGKWLENNVDWALSRERYWGTPLPVWRCRAGHEHCIGSVAELKQRATGKLPDDLHRPYIDEVELACEECGEPMRRVAEVIDAWYDSGSMPFAEWHYPFENEAVFEVRFPADFICEALDQTRGWFYSLLAIGTLLFGRSSYKNVLCLGLILDPEGQKMSKSRGNVVAPWDVIERHGADAFRWYYFTSQQPWSGYRFSVETVGESVRKFLLTLWNTYGFYVLYANIDRFDPAAQTVPVAERSDLDRWTISRLNGTVARVRERLDDYDTTNAGRAIAELVEDLSNWFVRRSRRRFWQPSGDGRGQGGAGGKAGGEPGEDGAARDKAAAYLTLHESLVTLAKLLAPFTPFVADDIYTNLVPESDSVHLCDYPKPDAELVDEELEFAMATARQTVRLGLAARSQAKLKVRQPLREAVVVATERERQALERLQGLVTDELNVKAVRFVHEAEELGRYEVKPNFKNLGPRFGGKMPLVKAAIEALDSAEVAARANRGEPVAISVDGRDETLAPDDLTLAMLPLDGYRVEREARHAVALSVELDDDLRREGLAREVVHAIQGVRKSAGLEVDDRIELRLLGGEDVIAAVRDHEDYVRAETLTAAAVLYEDELVEPLHIESVGVDGAELEVQVKKAAP